ncbi:MAG: class I SAM-dependent methyltransferase, partial [Gammaproteobacteria bacterium]|nr:class I SAM-dependent methyltransferase [Gammaproteobacteria bacterium]
MAARSEEILSEETKTGATMAERADVHELYEESVQNVEEECNFVRDTFRSLRGREATSFREDFCGTASAACYWTGFSSEHTAIGVDIDADVLEWGRKNRVGRLNPDRQARVRLMQSDVMDVRTEQADTIGAFNFSYWIFQTRPLMIEYFSKIHAALKPDGVIFLDAFGGYEAFEEMKEKTKYDNFTYVWDQ